LLAIHHSFRGAGEPRAVRAPGIPSDLDHSMSKHRSSVVLFFAMLFIPLNALSQVDISSVTVRLGAIRTLWIDITPYPGHMWSVYPELEIGGQFIVPCLAWGASWGYWSDGIDKAIPIPDMTTESSSSHIVAARIGFQPQRLDNHWPIPVEIFTGVAQHFIKQKHIGGSHYFGEGGNTSSETSATPFAGFGFSIAISTCLRVKAEALQFLPIGGRPIDELQKYRRAITLGVGVAL
jgi:hypothetical protein